MSGNLLHNLCYTKLMLAYYKILGDIIYLKF